MARYTNQSLKTTCKGVVYEVILLKFISKKRNLTHRKEITMKNSLDATKEIEKIYTTLIDKYNNKIAKLRKDLLEVEAREIPYVKARLDAAEAVLEDILNRRRMKP